MTINVPKRAEEKLAAGVRKFQGILASAHKRDANESDSVTIVVDMLADVFGFDKYTEITSEFSIRGTFCDLALKLDDSSKPAVLLEVKAVGQAEAAAKRVSRYGAKNRRSKVHNGTNTPAVVPPIACPPPGESPVPVSPAPIPPAS